MFLKSFFDENLAQNSYMVGCQKTGEALVIDPARDIQPYLETANKNALRITKVTETHIHADFLSGSRELANETGGALYLSSEGDEEWKYNFVKNLNHKWLKDGDYFHVGNVRLDVLHTPGHTPESLSFLLTDKGGKAPVPMGIFTGDFVFVGDVGRPDLLEKSIGASGTAEQGARAMFQSLSRFKELPDFIQVWPGHGAGSACGKSLGAVPSSTVGYEKITNWALTIGDENQFVTTLIDGQPEPPSYFRVMKKFNKEGPDLLPLDGSLDRIKPEEILYGEYTIIDTRSKEKFAYGHIEGSLNIPVNKSFANWSGWLLDYHQDITLVADDQKVDDIIRTLQSIGFDRTVGYIESTDVDNITDLEIYKNITVKELEDTLKREDYVIIDVRNQSEWEEGHMDQAVHIMLGTLPNRLDEIPKGKKVIVHCKSGGRSAIAASILQANGFKEVINVTGGYDAWKRYMETIK
ncbi:MBL fold metallo-hydrolase [Halobacillus shinanisalinarum]|uniref:MBL fold metallo-hydrolase n=1 Tax=Halobacillus shinanisalinarum TaxID=2932258 RepID=A0ABY4H467_9BACI|nr:MBL fold metallo-hydrolase [Halobacillus shinanisalinarum]UOQ95247.1 MBL fold metallo-hydrolase [Halobacillus shinanisalinarum]